VHAARNETEIISFTRRSASSCMPGASHRKRALSIDGGF
jgi:hypothetical protein